MYPAQRRAIGKGVRMYGWDSCRIARLLCDRSCRVVREKLQVRFDCSISGTLRM